MEILPPRRRGQLGAITAGAGVQGPSGGFSIQASSVARASTSPAPVKNPQAPPGSIAKPITPSVSEQVALKQSTSQAAAAKTMPAFSQGGTYSSNKPVVGVKSYVPPPGTPAITQPARQPNESKAVELLAKQIPQTKGQVIQQVLAKDAGIVMPLPAVRPPSAAAKMDPEKFVATLKADAKAITGQDSWGALDEWIKILLNDGNRADLERRIESVAKAGAKTEEAYNSMLALLSKALVVAFGIPAPKPIIPPNPPLPKFPPPPGLKIVTNPVVSPGIAPPRPPPFVPPASGGAVNVPGTTNPNIPNRMPPPPPPIITPAVMKTAAQATSAIVGAKIAEQKAINTMVAASQAAQNVAKIDSAILDAVAEAKDKVADATKKFSDLQAKNQKANEVLASQTASEDAKAKAQDVLREARDAAALAAKQAAEADAQAKQLAAEKAKAEQEQRASEAAAERAREEANAKKADALAKQAEAIDTQKSEDQKYTAWSGTPEQIEDLNRKLAALSDDDLMGILESAERGLQFKAGSPEQVAIAAPYAKAELDRRAMALVGTMTSRQMLTTQPGSGSGVSGTTIALGLGVLAALVYAASRRKTSLSDVPLIAELEEDEE